MPTLAIYGIIAALLFGAGAASGFKVESWRADARELAAVEAAEAAVQKGADQERAAAVATLQQQEKIRVVYQTVTKQVTKWRETPPGRAVCLDAAGIVLGNNALRSPAQAGPQPSSAVPGSVGGPGNGAGGGTPGQARPGVKPVL